MHAGVPIERGGAERPAAGATTRVTVVIAGALVVTGAVLRVLAARGDLWLDELWSIRLAADAGSIAGVFTRLHHDNNHYLNTLWVLLLGPGAAPLAYRLLSVASATATIALVAAWPLRAGRTEAIATSVLVGGSFLLVNYGSEARGYGPAMLCAVAAYQALERHLASRRTSWAGVFALWSVLGLLSHLTMLFALVGGWAWATVELMHHRRRPVSWLSTTLLAAPIAAAAALWAVDLRHMIIGGGPPWSLAEVLRELARTSLGLPRGWPELAALPVLGVALLELVAMARERDDRWVFFGVTLLVAPASLLAAQRPEFLTARYFVVAIPFVFLLLGGAAGRIARSGTRGRFAVVGMLVMFAIMNVSPVVRLLKFGRGRYGEALAMIAERTVTPFVTVGSDHDWRNGVVLEDQATRLGLRDRVIYLPASRWSGDQPEWLIIHDFAEQPVAEPIVVTPPGRAYRLVAIFPYGGLSGWSWIVYRSAAARGP